MKKILIPILVAAVLVTVFVACGSKEEMKNDLTTMMQEASTGLSEMDDMLTQNGNVTEDTEETEDLLDKLMTDEDITDTEETELTEETTEEDIVE